MTDKIPHQKVNKMCYRRAMLRDLREEYTETQINEIKERAMLLYLQAVAEAVKRINDISIMYKEAIDNKDLYRTERFQTLYYKEMQKFIECFLGIVSEAEMRDKAVQLFMKELKKSAKTITGDKK